MTDDREPRSSEDMLADVQEWLSGRHLDDDAVERPMEGEPPAPPDEPEIRAVERPVRAPAPRRAQRPPTPPTPRPTQTSPAPQPAGRPSIWNRPGTWTIFGLVLAAIGAGLLSLGIAQFALSGSWIEATGTVIDIDADADDTRVFIEYEVDGRSYAFWSGTNDDTPRMGGDADILVRPENPVEATTPHDRVVALVLRVVFGGVILLGSIVPAVWGRNLAKRRSAV